MTATIWHTWGRGVGRLGMFALMLAGPVLAFAGDAATQRTQPSGQTVVPGSITAPRQTPPPLPRVTCRGGRLIGRSCVCRPGRVRIRLARNSYWCMVPPKILRFYLGQ